MANFRLNCDAAVYATLNVTALTNLATGGVHNTIAPAGTIAPWVIFQMQSKVDTHSFNGRFANSLYTVKAVVDMVWPKEAEDIDTQIDTLLEDASLSITGYTLVLCRRESDITFQDVAQPGKTFQHVGGLYRIIADQS